MELNDELLGKLKIALARNIPFVERTGLEILELERGYVKMRMPLGPNINHVEMMYAGALYTLAELPGGAIFTTSFDVSRYYPIVKDMSIRFRRPAKSDVTVQAEADREGKADYEWDCELRDASGEVVATTHNVYQLRRIGS